MKHAFQALLRLYPYDYQAAFTKEILTAFESSARDRRARGFSVFLRLCCAEISALVFSAAAEWIAKLTTPKMIRGRSLPDLRMMRPAGVSQEAHFARAGK